MQSYYFYQHPSEHYTFVQKQQSDQDQQAFIWLDCTRQDVIGRDEEWQNEVLAQTGIFLNEYHLRDILNIDHPCVFDTMEDYDVLIFRKLITAEDQINITETATEKHESVFGLATSPMSFVITPNVLITVRETGNKAIENYIARIETMVKRDVEEQNKPRKISKTPLDLTLKLLNSMIDGYIDLRTPLTRRVEYWQQELLQGHRRFTKWNQLLQENMAFQQVENLCEEQIDCLQELRDEMVDNDQHLKARDTSERQDLLLLRVDDLTSHVERIQKYAIRLRTAIQAAIDLHFSAIANQTNENMRILAIITAVFAPLTLLTGIYGMNFEFMPGLKSPFGFGIMLAIMVITSLLLIYYFYRRHMVGRGEKSVLDLLAQQHHNQRINLLWFLDYEPIKQTIKEVEKITKLKP